MVAVSPVIPGLGQVNNRSALLIVGPIALFIFLIFFAVSPVFPQERMTESVEIPGEKSTPKATSFINHLNFSLTGRIIEYDNLDETYTFSPLDRFIPSAKNPCSIGWQEKKLYGTLTYDLLDSSYFRLSSGVHLGVSQAEFSATNINNGFYEWWQTEPALLWGIQVATELYREKKHGAFIRMRYDLFSSSGDEQKEIVRSRGGSAVNDTNARGVSFTWRNQEVQALVGWHCRFLTPLTGISYSRFNLNKRLVSNIVDPERDPLLIAAINAEDARFKYQNKEELAWLIALEWSVTESIEIIGVSRINSNQDWQLTVRFTF